MSCKDTGMCTSAAICFLDGCQDEIKATTASASEGELLPCHCGGKPQRQERMSWSYWVECSKCINETARKGSKREADEEWNLRRATAPSSNAAPLNEQVVQALWVEAGQEWGEGGRSQSLIFAQKVAALAQQGAAQAPNREAAYSYASSFRAVNRADFNVGYDAAQAAHAGADTGRDAARYTFLRHADLDAMAAAYWPGKEVPEGEEFDKAVDAAMSAATEQKEQK